MYSRFISIIYQRDSKHSIGQFSAVGFSSMSRNCGPFVGVNPKFETV